MVFLITINYQHKRVCYNKHMIPPTDNDIARVDKQNILAIIDSQPNQLRQNYADSMRNDITQQDGRGIENVVVVGMGGSALAGDLLKNWLQSRFLLPLEVVRNNTLPSYVNEHSLVIISSYSGNTEETLQAFEQAIKNNTQIMAFGNGGKLQELCKDKNITFFALPKVSQPRLAVFAGLKALACILEDIGAVQGDLRRELQNTADFLDTQKLAWDSDNQDSNLPMKLAQTLASKPTLIYTSALLESAGYKIKISINENAKQMAFADSFTELNHNEIEGWQSGNKSDFKVLIIKSSFESKESNKRIAITQSILEKHNFDVFEVTAKGDNLVQQILYCVFLGDFMSAYMAILNDQDPTKVELIEKLKNELR